MIDYIEFVLAPQVVNGLTIGVAIILVSLGLSIIFGLLDVVNMAHGEFYALGAFISMSLYSLGLGFWFALVVTPLLVVPLGVLLERGLIQLVYHRPARHVQTLLLTIGISIMLKDLYDLIYGPNTMRPDSPISGVARFGDIVVPNYRLFLMGFGTVVILLTWYVLFRTKLGSVIRAAAYDKDMTASLGVPVKIIYSGAFAFGTALAALAGVLLAPIYSVFPTMGQDFILLAFTVVIVGGIGSFWGTVVAGLLLTQIESLSALFIPPNWSEPLVFGIMIAVLIFRPQGLFSWNRR
jgi:branched-chain amino acid transport system permease protein